MNKKLTASTIILGFLLSAVSAYGFTFVPPPPQTFNGAGFVYAVEYECNYAFHQIFRGGTYDTNILVHNNQLRPQFVYIKILDGFNNVSLWVKNPNTNHYRFVIRPDGLLDIDCFDIDSVLGLDGLTNYTTGFIIVSQPASIDLTTTPLDVAAAYDVAVWGVGGDCGSPGTPPPCQPPIAGGSNDVVYITGTRVASIPTPCLASIISTCINLPP